MAIGFVAQPIACAPEKFEDCRVGEFRRAAQAAINRIDIIGELRRQSVGEGKARARSACRSVLDAPSDSRTASAFEVIVTLFFVKRLGDAAQHGDESRAAITRLLREIGAAPEGFAAGSEEHGHRPAAMFAEGVKRLHVDMIDIRPFLAIDLDVHEKLVHDRGGRSILETFVCHHVAPMAGGIADREKDRLIGGLCLREGRGAPEPPMDGIVLMLQQIGASGFGEFVGHDGP